MKYIKLSQGSFSNPIRRIKVDDSDFERINHYKWNICSPNKDHLYARAWISGKEVLVHRLIMNAPKGSMIDHKNMDTLDNRKENLRFCSYSQNAMNCKMNRDNTSGLRGVCWDKHHNRWVARIRSENKSHYLGHFLDINDAAVAYNKAAITYHGKFAQLNCI